MVVIGSLINNFTHYHGRKFKKGLILHRIRGINIDGRFIYSIQQLLLYKVRFSRKYLQFYYLPDPLEVFVELDYITRKGMLLFFRWKLCLFNYQIISKVNQ